MEKICEVFKNYIEKLYSESDPSLILEVIIDLIDNVPLTDCKDDMELTPLNHIFILMDKFNEEPEPIEKIVIALLRANKGKHKLFSDYIPIPKEKGNKVYICLI